MTGVSDFDFILDRASVSLFSASCQASHKMAFLTQSDVPSHLQFSDMENTRVKTSGNTCDDCNKEEVILDTNYSDFSSAPTLEFMTEALPDGGAEFIVWWEEPEDEDPTNPMNWSSTKKWGNICTISMISFIV